MGQKRPKFYLFLGVAIVYAVFTLLNFHFFTHVSSDHQCPPCDRITISTSSPASVLPPSSLPSPIFYPSASLRTTHVSSPPISLLPSRPVIQSSRPESHGLNVQQQCENVEIPLTKVQLSGPSHLQVALSGHARQVKYELKPMQPACRPSDAQLAFELLKLRINDKVHSLMEPLVKNGGPGIDRPIHVVFHDSFWGNQFHHRGDIDLAAADAVIFHLPNFGGFPAARGNPHQKWIALQFEPENIHGHLLDAALMSKIDATETYSMQSVIPVPYWADYVFEDPSFLRPVQRKDKRNDAYAVFMQYACSTPTRREDYVRQLMREMAIHSYGPCLNNKQDPRSSSNPRAITQEYVFSIVMENGNLPTYVTDKLYRAFQAGTIPIYRGAPDIGRYIPDRDAIIRVDDFDSPRALAQYLIQVGQNETLWNKHTAWRNQPDHLQEYFFRIARFQYIHSQCRVCMFAATGTDPLSELADWSEPIKMPVTDNERQDIARRITEASEESRTWNKHHSRFPLAIDGFSLAG